MYKRINSIQHVGVAVKDMDASLRFYRKFFGLDISFFDSVAGAPLMDVYTRNKTITKRASMVLNLKGGCAMEVISPTSFTPTGPKFEPQLGDFGIFITQVKCGNIKQSHHFCSENNAPGLSPIKPHPGGGTTFYIQDLDGNYFQFIEQNDWFTSYNHHSGGVAGCTIGVSNIDEALELYAEQLGYGKIVYDETGVFEDFSGAVHGGNNPCRRILLTQPDLPTGGFARLSGKTYIELVQATEYEPRCIFEDRIWADLGFVHLGFDVRGMKKIGEDLAKVGYGFTCDSNDALSMGKTKVHCTYIEDKDSTWIELIEVYKVPIIEKWGVFLNVEKRAPEKPLPNAMLKALKFSRIKD